MLRVSGPGVFDFWTARLAAAGIATYIPDETTGFRQLHFEDHEGQRLALIDDDGGAGLSHPWVRSDVPTEHQIRGLGPVTVSAPIAG